MYKALILLLFVAAASTAAQAADDAILSVFRDGSTMLRAGKWSYVAAVQARLNELGEGCRPVPGIGADGEFGPGTRAAVKKAVGAGCAAIGGGGSIPADSAARSEGAITAGLWHALFPDRAAPGVYERAMAIVLTYEATDFDRAEWNFCQNRPRYDPAAGQPVCFTNDPRSFLTWGPRGATAGHGAEVQQVLHVLNTSGDAAARALLDDAFGNAGRAAAVRRLLALNASDTERFLCGVWLDPAERAAWKSGLAKLGASEASRRVYEAVYAASDFDGGKIASYYRMYARAGLTVSEVDHGFMVDRATHMSGPSPATIELAVRAMDVLGSGGKSGAQLRLWLMRNFRPGNPEQRADRLGRDVAFVLDALEGSLTEAEKQAWRSRGKLRASEAGLREDAAMPGFTAPPLSFSKPPRGTLTLTEAERARCPAAILNPQAPPK